MAISQDLWAIFNQDETPYQYQQVRGGGDFGAGYNVGSAIAQNIQNARINRRNNQRRNDSRRQAINGLPGYNGSANGGAVTGAIGADENGIYGVPNQQPTTVIGADANGVYGVNSNTGGNNVLYQGSPNWTMPGNGSTKIGQPELNITDQTIGQNYNQRIDSQTQGGFNIPRIPQTPNNGFKSIFGSDSNTGVFGSNPQSPVASSVDQALTGGGTITSASLYGQPQQQRQDMSNLRNIQEWMAADRAQGVTNPIISMMRYQAFMEPMEKQRREDNLRDAFATLRNPEATEEQIMNAYATLEYELKRPGLKEDMERKEDEFYAKQGMMRNQNYSGGDSEYGGDDENARAIYSHLASKGIPANVIAGIMGNLQAESGFNSSAVGDGGQSIGLAQWYDSRGNNLRNFAKQRGKEWNDVDTQLDFLLDEVQQSNPDLLQRMAKLSPHEAAILFHDEFERSADTPEMKARRGEYASNIFNGRRQSNKYVRDPNWVSPREKFNAEQSYRDRIARAREYRAYGNPTRDTGDVKLPKVKATSPQDYSDAVNAYSSADIPSVEQTHKIGQAFAPEFQEYITHFNGNVEQALKQMYYDKNADGRKGYSMNPQKLARAIAAASAYAQGVPPDKFDGYMNDAANYLVSSFSGNQQTSSENKSGGQEGNNNIIKVEKGKPNGNSNSSWSFSNMFGGIGNIAKRAKEGGSIGTSDVGDLMDEASSGFMRGVERDREERRNKQKDEERDRFNSLR